MKPKLLSPLKIRGLEIKNRLWMAPMCQYTAAAETDIGQPHEYHLNHYGLRADSGIGLVMVEACAVTPEGRITAHDLGLWDDAQIPSHQKLTERIKAAGATAAIQLAHAGRKASSHTRAEGGGPLAPDHKYAWQCVAPSAVPYENHPVPKELSKAEILELIDAFANAARRAIQAGYEVIQIHAAHGYLIHQFLSPVSNHRKDEYGSTLENRLRFALEVAQAVRAVMPNTMPLMSRISFTDWLAPENSWDFPQAVALVKEMSQLGVDLVDVSSGGITNSNYPLDVDYQTTPGRKLRAEVDLLVSSVGRITEAQQAYELTQYADLEDRSRGLDAIFVGRKLFRSPNWFQEVQSELNG